MWMRDAVGWAVSVLYALAGVETADDWANALASARWTTCVVVVVVIDSVVAKCTRRLM